MFIWVLTFAFFFGIMFLSLMVTRLKSSKIKKAKENLALLDVNPGTTIYKNPDGAKLVQKKLKNSPGGAATVAIIFGILVLVSYVLATEFDQPGELGFQRKLFKSCDDEISFRSTAFDVDSKALNPRDHHKLDLGLILDNAAEPTDPFFVSSDTGHCVPKINNCNNEAVNRYVTTSFDFWELPTKTEVTLCGNLPSTRLNNSLSFFMLSPPVGNGAFRASAVVFDESLTRWETNSAADVLPRFEISVTAVTAYELSVLLVEYILPPGKLHKLRVDHIDTKAGITTTVCPNPIAQFIIIGNVWEINSIYFEGLSNVIISAIGAAGMLFSVRTTIKSGFEYLATTYHASLRKRRALTITGYSIQTLFGAFSPLAVFFGANLLLKISAFTEQVNHIIIASFVFAAIIWLFWIFSTVVFARNIREIDKSCKLHDAGIELINESGPASESNVNYVQLESE